MPTSSREQKGGTTATTAPIRRRHQCRHANCAGKLNFPGRRSFSDRRDALRHEKSPHPECAGESHDCMLGENEHILQRDYGLAPSADCVKRESSLSSVGSWPPSFYAPTYVKVEPSVQEQPQEQPMQIFQQQQLEQQLQQQLQQLDQRERLDQQHGPKEKQEQLDEHQQGHYQQLRGSPVDQDNSGCLPPSVSKKYVFLQDTTAHHLHPDAQSTSPLVELDVLAHALHADLVRFCNEQTTRSLLLSAVRESNTLIPIVCFEQEAAWAARLFSISVDHPEQDPLSQLLAPLLLTSDERVRFLLTLRTHLSPLADAQDFLWSLLLRVQELDVVDSTNESSPIFPVGSNTIVDEAQDVYSWQNLAATAGQPAIRAFWEFAVEVSNAPDDCARLGLLQTLMRTASLQQSPAPSNCDSRECSSPPLVLQDQLSRAHVHSNAQSDGLLRTRRYSRRRFADIYGGEGAPARFRSQSSIMPIQKDRAWSDVEQRRSHSNPDIAERVQVQTLPLNRPDAQSRVVPSLEAMIDEFTRNLDGSFYQQQHLSSVSVGLDPIDFLHSNSNSVSDFEQQQGTAESFFFQ